VAATGFVLLLTAAGTASAHKPERMQSADSARNVMTAPFFRSQRGSSSFRALQHGGDTDHLPATRKNMELVSKFEPVSQGPIEDGQIADVAVFKGFAYLASWNTPGCGDGTDEKGGTYVVDVRNPAAPKEVKFLPALPGNYHGEGMQAISIDTPAFKGDVLAVNNETCRSVTHGGGFDLYDVTDPTNPKRFDPPEGADFSFGDFGGEGSLVKDPGDTSTKANDAHSIFIWDAGDKAYAVIVDNEESHDVDIFDITNPRRPEPVREYDLTEETPAWTETANGDTPFLHDMVVKKIGPSYVMLASYWDAGYIQMDATNPADMKYLSDSDFGTSDPLTGFDPPEGNAHQAEFTNDDKHIVTGEEDFSAYRLTQVTVNGVGNFAATEVGGGGSPNALPDEHLNGPMAYGGYACPDSKPVPNALTTFPTVGADEERILVVQRGPTGDTNDDYEACFPGEKADTAKAAGWDGILIVNRHLGTEADDANPYCGSGGYTQFVATACTTHEAGHAIFDDSTPEYGTPYDDEAEMATVGQKSPYKLDATGTFDGWGYMSMYSTAPDGNGKLPLEDAYAIPEALNPDYASGFGDLTVHEQAADPTAPLSYSSYYAGGLRVFSYEGGKITPQGAFIDQEGNNFWGVEQFTAANGERLIAGSDRDYGLYIVRYTGPFAVKATPASGGGTPPPAGPKAGRCTNLLAVTAGKALAGSDFGEQITGTEGADTVDSKGGDDCIDGLGGNDDLRGGAGVDTIDGQKGSDRVRGDSGRGNLRGGSGNDRVTGGSSKDTLFGNSGRDRLSGGGGNDSLFGGSGNDRITGGKGKNVIEGGTGNDRIFAKNGRSDRIDCGFGKDNVVSRDRSDKLTSCEKKASLKKKKKSKK
jgi:Ca2+-binding RTX toxin-like protein